MRVLVACEFSGVVRDAFSALGHDAWSCDLLPTDRPGKHLQGDVLGFIDRGWDLMIAHPPCTYLCSSGLHWNTRRPERAEKTEEALRFVRRLLGAPVDRIALENPVGCISTRIRKPNQVVQPWQFGDDASKATCLWLQGLDCLEPTEIVPPAGWKMVRHASDLFPCEMCEEPVCNRCADHFAECACPGPHQDELEYRRISGVDFAIERARFRKPVWGNQTPSGQNSLGPSLDRWKKRSLTYRGIAAAMAAQWGRV